MKEMDWLKLDLNLKFIQNWIALIEGESNGAWKWTPYDFVAYDEAVNNEQLIDASIVMEIN